MKEHAIFAFLPVDEMVKEYQSQYYDVLGKSDLEGESTAFAEFMMDIIVMALVKYGKEH